MSNDLKEYFENEINNDRKDLKKRKKESKEIYIALKKELINSKNNEGINSAMLVHSVGYADVLRHNSYENYKVLMNYAHFGLKHLDEGSKNIYEAFKKYCAKYDKISKVLVRKILSNNKAKDLVSTESMVENSLDRLTKKYEDLVCHVYQIVEVNNKLKVKKYEIKNK